MYQPCSQQHAQSGAHLLLLIQAGVADQVASSAGALLLRIGLADPAGVESVLLASDIGDEDKGVGCCTEEASMQVGNVDVCIIG